MKREKLVILQWIPRCFDATAKRAQAFGRMHVSHPRVFAGLTLRKPIRVRKALFALSLVLTVGGAAWSWDQWQATERNDQLAEARLQPDLPLMAVAETSSPNLGARLATLRIPSIEVEEVVVEGVRAKDLATGIGHYPGSALPGEVGTVAIAGHRTGWGDPLLRTGELEPGDRIVLRTATERLVYRVTNTKIVEPEATWVLDGDPKSKAKQRLAITTCDPPYTSRYRLVIWADRVS